MKIIFSDGEEDYPHDIISKLEPFLYTTPDDTIELLQYQSTSFKYFYCWLKGINELNSLGYNYLQEIAHLADFLCCENLLSKIIKEYPFCLIVHFISTWGIPNTAQYTSTCGSKINITINGYITIDFKTKAPIYIKTPDKNKILLYNFTVNSRIQYTLPTNPWERNFILLDLDIEPTWWYKAAKLHINIYLNITSEKIEINFTGINLCLRLTRDE